MDESRVSFDGPDGWTKVGIVFNSDVYVAKRSRQRDGSVMMWAEIVGQIIIGPFKVDD